MKKLTICIALALSAVTLSASSPYGFKDVMLIHQESASIATVTLFTALIAVTRFLVIKP